MKKTLLISLFFPPQRGGISNSLWNTCINLPQDKIVVLTKPSKVKPKADFKIYRRKILSNSKFIWPRWICLFWYTKKIIKKEEIEIIQAGQILPIGTVALIFKKLFKIPYHVYVYGQDILIMRRSKRKINLIKIILKNANMIITNSNYTKQKTVELGAAPEKMIVVYPSPLGLINNNIDQQYFEYFINKNDLKNKKIILSVGNIVERKGQDTMIKVMPKLLKRFPEAIYLIVGRGPYKKNLEKIIKDLNLQKNVRIFENISDEELPYFYHACDVFTMLSRELKNKQGQVTDIEGFGIVYLEANLFGKPVIGGNSGGVAEAIEHNVSGILVDPVNINEITENFIKILSDKQFRQQLGEKGRARALNEFQWLKEVDKIRQILR